MKVEDLITDEAIKIVFKNTNFDSRTPRELIAKGLDQVKNGYHIGHTMQCCLLELGLIFLKSYKIFGVTQLGEKYLELISSQPVTIITERRIVRQEWYETECSKTGWDSHGWCFNDTGDDIELSGGWAVVKHLDSDKFGNPYLGIAEKETDIESL